MALTGNKVKDTYLDLVQLEQTGAGLPSHAGAPASLYDGAGNRICNDSAQQNHMTGTVKDSWFTSETCLFTEDSVTADIAKFSFNSNWVMYSPYAGSGVCLMNDHGSTSAGRGSGATMTVNLTGDFCIDACMSMNMLGWGQSPGLSQWPKAHYYSMGLSVERSGTGHGMILNGINNGFYTAKTFTGYTPGNPSTGGSSGSSQNVYGGFGADGVIFRISRDGATIYFTVCLEPGFFQDTAYDFRGNTGAPVHQLGSVSDSNTITAIRLGPVDQSVARHGACMIRYVRRLQ